MIIHIFMRVLCDEQVRHYRDVEAAHGHGLRTHQRSDPFHVDGFVRGRALELLQGGPHPSAFLQRRRQQDDAYDPERGIAFGYNACSEPCCNGMLHPNSGLVRCWVHNGSLHMRCSSCEAEGARPSDQVLGPLHSDADVWATHAIHVNMQYLDPQHPVLQQLLCQWKGGVFKALNLRSVMGTGKTTLMQHVLSHVFPNCRVSNAGTGVQTQAWQLWVQLLHGRR
jgi:hypothetical protein